MLGAAVIVFRESLEAALLIGIVAAATRAVPNRSRFIVVGGASGALGAVALALVAEQFPAFFGGSGQDLFNAAVLGVAVLMLAWHNIWMSRHAAEMVASARSLGAAVARGDRTLTAVAVLVGVAVLREGAETVLFLFGLASGGDLSAPAAVGGTALGIFGGALAGAAAYFGLARIPVRQLFSVTGTLLLLLAAGMAGQAARFLIQGDLLPPLASPLWDSSRWLPGDSTLGVLLHVLMGYDARPSGMQVIFFAAALLLIGAGTWASRRPQGLAAGPRQSTVA